MDWSAVGAVGEVVGAIAVFGTLLYLSVQVRETNKQAELEGFRHTLDGFNEWMDQVVSSKQTASVLRRGREDMAGLDEDERLQFEYLHLRFLNTLESWYRSVDLTSRDAEYRRVQIANFKAAVHFVLDNPGSREVWKAYRVAFPIVADVIDQTLESPIGELKA
jgi:hypothetical protein